MFGRGKSSGVLKWSLIGSAIAGGIALIPLVPALKKKAMRATTLLKKDHRVVSGLMMTLEMTPKFSAMARKALFNQIRADLMVHTQVEEEIFYPAIRNLATLLEPDGALFGATVLGTPTLHTWLSRAALRQNNRLGFFDNLSDTEAQLRELLAEMFVTVDVDIVGSVAIFAVTGQR